MKEKMHLEMLLKMLGLKTFLKNYETFADKAQKQKLGYCEYLYQLVQMESDEKQNRKVGRLLKNSKLPDGKTLDSFDIAGQPGISASRLRELSSGDCLDHCESILVFGVPGTGKSHLSAALGREWCLRGRKVLYTTASALVQDLLAAKRDLKLNELIDKLDGFEALIIDDISYVPQTRDETDVLFVLLAKRYETRSVVITSNLVFSEWENIFKDKMTTKAAVDRLVHHGTILELVEIEGESYRERVAKAKAKQRKQAPVKKVAAAR
jgi:DNA replication protein DnaC